MKQLSLLATALAAALLTGCAGVNQISGKIVSVNSTCLGLDLSQAQTDPVPHLRFGLIRSTYTIVPVSTNGVAVTAPNYKTGMRAQHKLWSLDANEELATGESNVVISAEFDQNTNVFNASSVSTK